ncbi:MAG: hybrid sensor histidine kinase/response regulator [Deltaproteobacteria bacterium]|nr:hybrid sensor histidine kinase/response regulator [Deltaproteobacteria bacterium]
MQQQTVLVVDDDERNRAVVRGILGAQYQVKEADSAAAALAAVRAGGVDLVLLDVMMPGVSGLDACRSLKDSSPDFLPVLLVTALYAQEDRNQGLEAGADDFLSKPVDRRELLLRVAAFLRIRHQEAQIRAQLDALHQLDALKDDLMSLIVHDLRNPLTSLFAFLQVARDELTGEVRDDVDNALIMATRVNDTITDILRVKQLEDGVLEPKTEPVSLAALVADAVKTVAGHALEREVQVRQASGDADLMVDRSLLRRCVENLLANAIKFSPRNGVVDVEVAADATTVSVMVADRGAGIPKDARRSLFQKFGGATVAPNARRGYGLGLYLVRLVAEAHGGEVEASDREGGGTVMRVTLPRARSQS